MFYLNDMEESFVLNSNINITASKKRVKHLMNLTWKKDIDRYFLNKKVYIYIYYDRVLDAILTSGNFWCRGSQAERAITPASGSGNVSALYIARAPP